MTPEKMKQIEADAEAYRNNLGLEPHIVYSDLIKDAYIAGRKDEADKAAALVEEKYKEIERLKAWKESAISVTPPIQEIANALDIGLGESTHDKILPRITEMINALQTICHTYQDGTMIDIYTARYIAKKALTNYNKH